MSTKTPTFGQPPSTGAPAHRQDQTVRGRSRRHFALGAIFCLFAIPAGHRPAAETPPESRISLSAPRAATLPVLHDEERVRYWIRAFTTREREEFQHGLERRGRYDAMIRAALRERGMPEGLIYLAHVESGFKPTARSKANAVGMWQFMAPTARAYGLRVDRWVDERRDPRASTRAALDHLSDLYDIYGSWHLAAAAYNAGAGRVNRALDAHAGGQRGSDALYWQVIDHLPQETQHYVPRLIAATTIGEHADAFGFQPSTTEPRAAAFVRVRGGTTIEEMAKVAGIESERIRELNPHLIRGAVPPDLASMAIRVPLEAYPKIATLVGMSPRRYAARLD